MTGEHKYDDVLIRFLLNESTQAEEAFVLNWIEEDPANKLYLESLIKTLDLISLRANSYRLDAAKEWLRFEDRVIENRKSRKAKIFKLVISTAVAASIIFMVALQWGWLTPKNVTDHLAKKNPAPGLNNIDSLLAIKVREINTSGKTKTLVLPDGSLVALSNNSELIYQEPVKRNKREVYLSGKADFEVAKEKSKPFTVYSEAISTTALGTRFSVTALKNEKQILVRLHEGKIVVKPAKANHNNGMKDFYLLPGQELVYNKITETASVSKFDNDVAQKRNSQARLTKETPSMPQFDKHSWFMFNNQPLSDVFDDLAEMYHTRIHYSKKDVQNISFIGTFDKSDSLELILKKIAAINNLQLTKDSNNFKIKK